MVGIVTDPEWSQNDLLSLFVDCESVFPARGAIQFVDCESASPTQEATNLSRFFLYSRALSRSKCGYTKKSEKWLVIGGGLAQKDARRTNAPPRAEITSALLARPSLWNSRRFGRQLGHRISKPLVPVGLGAELKTKLPRSAPSAPH